MPINAETVIARVRASIDDLRTALSISNCQKLHAELTDYCGALLETNMINNTQWAYLCQEANKALDDRKNSPDLQLQFPD